LRRSNVQFAFSISVCVPKTLFELMT
jgi:hypothetical protein